MDSSSYVVTLRDRTIETIDGADAFSHERLMTTFYRCGNARATVDCWSVPLASFRTDEILMIRRVEPEAIAGAGFDEHFDAEFSGLQVVPEHASVG